MAKQEFKALADVMARAAGAGKRTQPMPSAAEIFERQSQFRTQGRKGCKLRQIYVKLTPDNLEYTNVLARASGRTRSQFLNVILDNYRAEHPELVELARRIKDEATALLDASECVKPIEVDHDVQV